MLCFYLNISLASSLFIILCFVCLWKIHEKSKKELSYEILIATLRKKKYNETIFYNHSVIAPSIHVLLNLI